MNAEDASAGEEFPIQPGIVEAVENARFLGAAGDRRIRCQRLRGDMRKSHRRERH